MPLKAYDCRHGRHQLSIASILIVGWSLLTDFYAIKLAGVPILRLLII